MNRLLALVMGVLTLSSTLSLVADTLSEATALAAQREAEERYRRLSADVQTLLDTQEVLLKRQEEFRQRLDKLADEIRNLKDDQSRNLGNVVSKDELRRYVEKLKELDDKREADKKLILENIKDLAKAPPVPAVAPEPKNNSRQRATETPSEPAFVYVIKKNDRLSEIVAEYNDYFQKHGQAKITIDQVVKANPGLKPDLLIEGRKLRIPTPGKKD